MKKYFVYLAVIDIFWSISALIYDWHEILSLPYYLWPFIIICPLYPLLLTLFWLRYSKGSKIHNLLAAFAALPSVIYFLGAIIYYPLWMIQNHFDWLAFGQIFWVAFYGIQGFYILKTNRISKTGLIAASVFLAVSFGIQYVFRDIGYFNFDGFSRPVIIGSYALLALMAFAVSCWKIWSDSSERI